MNEPAQVDHAAAGLAVLQGGRRRGPGYGMFRAGRQAAAISRPDEQVRLAAQGMDDMVRVDAANMQAGIAATVFGLVAAIHRSEAGDGRGCAQACAQLRACLTREVGLLAVCPAPVHKSKALAVLLPSIMMAAIFMLPCLDWRSRRRAHTGGGRNAERAGGAEAQRP
ncbi:MAG: hypothetical protein EA356_14465 [Geminicoccaceae bacterium]|nr:MAG: hypothetical protein EA356_14465 [Geminicoccaceae bacterium]